MPKRISKTNKRKIVPFEDVNQAAFRIVQQSTAETEPKPEVVDRALLSKVMSQMGRKGGRISGKRRMVNLTAEKRREIALKAAQARWMKAKSNKKDS